MLSPLNVLICKFPFLSELVGAVNMWTTVDYPGLAPVIVRFNPHGYAFPPEDECQQLYVRYADRTRHNIYRWVDTPQGPVGACINSQGTYLSPAGLI
jgi:hypothetical protein